MALPTSRNTTYSAGSQVLSADLNDIQDKIIDNHYDGTVRLLAAAGHAAGSSSINANGTWVCSSGSDALIVAIPGRPGAEVTAIRARVLDDTGGAGTTVNMAFVRVTDGSPTVLTQTASNGSGTVQTIGLSALTTVMPDINTDMDDYYGVKFTPVTGTTCEVYGLEIVMGTP